MTERPTYNLESELAKYNFAQLLEQAERDYLRAKHSPEGINGSGTILKNKFVHFLGAVGSMITDALDQNVSNSKEMFSAIDDLIDRYLKTNITEDVKKLVKGHISEVYSYYDRDKRNIQGISTTTSTESTKVLHSSPATHQPEWVRDMIEAQSQTREPKRVTEEPKLAVQQPEWVRQMIEDQEQRDAKNP